MKSEHKRYILQYIDQKSVKELAQELNIRKRTVRKFIERYKAKQKLLAQQKAPLKKPFVFLAISLIIILGFLVYANTLEGTFLWDDNYLVKNNLYIRNPSYFLNLFTENIGAGARGRFSFYRPLQMVSYMFDYTLWKLNPFGYHLTNTILHILVGGCIFWLISMLFKDAMLSLASALLFVVHPLHTEAVSYISGRADSLVAIFLFLTFIFYLKSLHHKRESFPLFFMALFYGCALISRENSLILPVLLLWYHYSLKEKFRGKYYFPLAGLALVYLILRVGVFKFLLPHTLCPYTFAQRLPGVFVAFTGYLRLLIAPFSLHMEYGEQLFSWSDPKAIAGVLIFLFLAISALRMRRRFPLYSFSVGWFLITLFPSSNIYPINAYMAEHWLYIPSIGFLLLLAKGISALYHKKAWRIMGVGVLIVFILGYSYLTVKQNRKWKDPFTLYEWTLKFVDDSPVVYNNLGILWGDKGDMQKAISLFKKAIATNPNYVYAYNNLGKAHSLRGEKQKAITYYKKAIELYPKSVDSYYNLGNIYTGLGRNEEAISSYKKAIELSPHFAQAHYNLANIYKRLKQFDKAIALYKKAVAIDAEYCDAYNNLGLTYLEIDKNKEALGVFHEAVKIKPDSARINFNLALAYFENEQYQKAIEYFDKAKALGYSDPHFEKILRKYRQ